MSTILITGSGRRLGKGMAIEFAKKGWNVIIHYNSSESSALETMKKISEIGVNCLSFKSDVNDTLNFREQLLKITKEIEFPKVLVNNAAIYPAHNKLKNTSSDLWDSVIDTNLKSYFEISKIFAEYATTDSRIINIASMGAFRIWKGRIPYNVSKAGVIQLTKALAYDLAPKISVNSVSPGSIDIPEDSPIEELALKSENIPMKRYGNIKDVFDAVNFFAECTSYITGQNICVDGGYNL